MFTISVCFSVNQVSNFTGFKEIYYYKGIMIDECNVNLNPLMSKSPSRNPCCTSVSNPCINSRS